MADRPAGTFSGGPIENFSEGWARIPFKGRLAHYWRDVTEIARKAGALNPDAPADAKVYESDCKLLGCTSARVPPLNPGNIPTCKHCRRIAPRWTRREERQTFLETDPAARAALEQNIGRKLT